MTRAIEDYTKAIGLDPKDASAYHNRGLRIGQRANWIAQSKI